MLKLKPRISMLLIMMSFSFSLFSQNVVEDSLLYSLKTARNKHHKLKSLNELIFHYRFSPETAKHYGRLALDLGEGDTALIARSSTHLRLGIVYDITDKLDSSLYYYGIALQFADSAQSEILKGSIYNNFGMVYNKQGLYPEAIESYMNALKIFEKLDNKLSMANANNNISLIMDDMGNPVKALEYAHTALALFKEVNNQYGIGSALNNIGLIWMDTDADSSIHYTLKSIEVKTKIDDFYGLAKAHNNLAILYRDEGEIDIDKALYHFNMALEYNKLTKSIGSYASTLFNMANVYDLKKKDYKKALQLLNEAEQIALEIQYTRLLWKIYANKSSLYAKQKNYKNAYQYLLKKDEIRDTIIGIQQIELVADMEEKYQSEKKEKELLVVKEAKAQADLATAQATLDAQNKTKWIWTLLLVSSIGGFGALAYLQWFKKKKKSELDEALIREKERGLREIIRTTEEDRKRIARDLHDGICQQLGGIKMGVEHLKLSHPENELLKEQASKLGQYLEEISAETRELSHRMMPGVLLEMGLEEALKELTERFQTLAGLKLSFSTSGNHTRISEQQEIAIYRITQELLNNILKHSGAREVGIFLRMDREKVVLLVEDDGSGVEESKIAQGFTTLRSRMEVINGHFSVQSERNRGTLVTVRLPLMQSA